MRRIRKVILLFLVFALLLSSGAVFAYIPRIIYNQKDNIEIKNPETFQIFFDELGGRPRNYLISSDRDFDFYVNILVPSSSNPKGRYSLKIFSLENGFPESGEMEESEENKIAFVDGQTDFEWKEFYDSFGRDYYLKGPEFSTRLPGGNYGIVVFSYENRGKYALALGKEETLPILELLGIYWKLPLLKIEFFKTSPIEFFATNLGLLAVGIVIALLCLLGIRALIGLINEFAKKKKPKIMLLTSSGMQGSKEEIMALLSKPAHQVRVANIITGSKAESDPYFAEQDERLMKETGFNVENIDIEGKNKNQLMKMLLNVDIIYVQGGNAFYLLKQMRKSGFNKIIKKLLSKGVIYIGVGDGSIAAGKTIETAGWRNEKDKFGLMNHAGLNLVNFNIFTNYKPEDQALINQKSKKAKNNLRILTDEQAIFVFNKKIILVGKGEAVVPK